VFTAPLALLSVGLIALSVPLEATDPPAPGGLPITIEHRFGSTTITEVPERIAVVGLTEQDALLALGVVPVATTEWFGGHPGAIWPWARDELDALGGELPASTGTSMEYNFEAIAAAEPDLILALYSGLYPEEYDLLSAIAPTVAQPDDYVDFGIPWDELTRTVGAIVGRSEAAEALVAGVESDVARARAEHPEFDGATALMATPYDGVYVYSPEDVRGRFLTSLGFALPDDLGELAGDEFGATLSAEEIDYVDRDLVVWIDAPADLALLPANDIYRGLRVHTEGRDVFLQSDDVLGAATTFVSVLSLPYLIDGLVPLMAQAIDGDPATTVGA